MAWASTEILWQKTKILDSWTKALEDHNFECVDKSDESNVDEDDELNLNRGWDPMKEDPDKELVTGLLAWRY